MRHRIKGRRFSRTKEHRKALFKNLAQSLIKHEQIKTTLYKAKDLRPIVEKMITKAKKGGLANRRLVYAQLRDDTALSKLFDVLAPRYAKRAGGYTRVLKAGYRDGDSAAMAVIEFVERDETARGKNSGPVQGSQKEETEGKASKVTAPLKSATGKKSESPSTKPSKSKTGKKK